MATPIQRVKAGLEAIKDSAISDADLLALTEAYIIYNDPGADLATLSATQKAKRFLNYLRLHLRMATRPIMVTRKVQAATAAARQQAEAEADAISLGVDE